MPEGQQGGAPSAPPADDGRWGKALGRLWEKQSQWSLKADELKRAYRSWTGPLVVAGFVGVVLSTASPELVKHLASPNQAVADRNIWQIIVTLAGPIIVAGAAVLTREMLSRKTEQLWAKARGVSEALKAQGYLYAAGAPPYVDRRAAPQQLAKAMDELTSSSSGEVGVLPAPAAKLEEKHPHEALLVDRYIDRRVKPQIKYHLDGALDYRDKLKLWRGVGVALAVVSGALGVIAGVVKGAGLNVWMAVVSTAVATLTSFVYAGRYEYFTASYFATSERLTGRLTSWEVAEDKSEAERGRFILDCEAILTAQNQSWMNELSKRASEAMDRAKKAQPPGP